MQELNVKGTVSTIIFNNQANGYTVFVIDTKGGEMTCTGITDGIEVGDTVDLSGSIKYHPKYGKQFAASSVSKTIPADIRVYPQYLAETITGVGIITATRMVSEFGEDVFHIIQSEPEKLARVRGISKNKAKAISREFNAVNTTREESLLFLKLGISASQAKQIKERYEDKVKEMLEKNPYKLINEIKGIGFIKADAIAKKMGITEDCEFRLIHGLLYVLDQSSVVKGHVYMPKEELIREAAKVLSVEENLLNPVLDILEKAGEVVISGKRVYTTTLYNNEIFVAERLLKLNQYGETNESPEVISEKIKKIEKQRERILDESQHNAVINAALHNVLVMTGGPGTGKTTTLDVIIAYLRRYYSNNILLLAPTGRAAKRISEQTGMEASTIHRICTEVECNGEDSTIEDDVIIIDEMSMVDISLLSRLLSIIEDGTKLILVGDVDQLPSVGPGTVLRDIINSGAFPVSYLTKIHRQAAENRIIVNAHKINHGEYIDLSDKHHDFCFIEEEDEEEAFSIMREMVTNTLPRQFDIQASDIQIMAPMRKGELGIHNLNIQMQALLNPESPLKPELALGETVFRLGDKVMHTKNDYTLPWVIKKENWWENQKGSGVFNGEIGFIVDIDTENETVSVLYDGERLAQYDTENMNEITLAYAITIHKAQGSEYPVIVIPLVTNGPPMLYNRNLLYTAVTRASKSVVLIGREEIIRHMIANTKSQKRYTGLCEQLGGS